MKDILAKARTYQRKYRIIGRAHYLAADRCTRFHRLLSIPVIVITAVIGTTIFSTLNQNPDPKWKIVAGAITLASTILSSLQASLGFSQLAEKHKGGGERYRGVCRRFELFQLRYSEANPAQREAAMNDLEKIVADLEELAPDYPAVPDRCFRRATKEQETLEAENDPLPVDSPQPPALTTTSPVSPAESAGRGRASSPQP